MLDRQMGEFVFMCDACEDVLETGEREFEDAHRKRAVEDWTAKKADDGEWEHYCPDCWARR